MWIWERAKFVKTFNMLAVAVTATSTIALTACDGELGFGASEKPFVITITETEESPVPAVAEVPADSVLSVTGGFHYLVGGTQGNCQLFRMTLTCGGTPPAENSLVNERGVTEKAGAVSLGDSGISWHAREIVGGIHDEKVLPIGQSFTKDGFTCSQSDENTFTCTSDTGGFDITGSEAQISVHEGTLGYQRGTSVVHSDSDYVDVDPALYYGRDGWPVFDFSNGGPVMGFCGIKEDSVWCGIGEKPTGENEVVMTDHSVNTFRGEGPLQTGLKKLQSGERISYGNATCYRPDATSIVCTVGPELIRIVGPNYQLKINGAV